MEFFNVFNALNYKSFLYFTTVPTFNSQVQKSQAAGQLVETAASVKFMALSFKELRELSDEIYVSAI